MKPGDLVSHKSHNGEFIGIVISVRPMENIFRDSLSLEPVLEVHVMFDKDLPHWMGSGRFASVTDQILTVIS